MQIMSWILCLVLRIQYLFLELIVFTAYISAVCVKFSHAVLLYVVVNKLVVISLLLISYLLSY